MPEKVGLSSDGGELSGKVFLIFLIFSLKYCKKLFAKIVSDEAVGNTLTFSASIKVLTVLNNALGLFDESWIFFL